MQLGSPTRGGGWGKRIIYREGHFMQLGSPTGGLGGGGGFHMKGTGMLVGNCQLNPQRRPIWMWLKLNLT